MGEHKKQGKTFFVTVDDHNQLAIHRSPSGHFTCIRYCDGVQMHKAERILQYDAALKMGLTVQELLEKFKLDESKTEQRYGRNCTSNFLHPFSTPQPNGTKRCSWFPKVT